MTRTLAMFPGQGSQYVGMGKSLLEQFPGTASVFEEAEDAIQVNLRKICFEGPDEDLRLTANTQPCILTVSVAMWSVLQGETGLSPFVFAGHSLGEYSALVAAGRLSLARAVTLVRRRGEAMQDAVPAGIGAMAAVMNMESHALDDLCKTISTPEHTVQCVNYNSPQQVVVAGHKTAVEALCVALEGQGIRYVVLPVSAPFHSSLMTKAREAMEPLLTASEFTQNDTQMIPNFTGEVVQQYGAEMLVEQIDHAVLWTKTMQTATELECDTYVEVGPGKVLMGLARRCLPRTVKIIPTDDMTKAIGQLNEVVS